MAYIAPSTRSAGALITAAIWNQDVVANPIAIFAGAQGLSGQTSFDDMYSTSTTQWAVGARQLRQTFRGLTLRTHPDADVAAYKVRLDHADEIVMHDGTRVADWDDLTADITASGANGLDTGSEAASTWYEIHAIRKSADGTKGLLLHRAKNYLLDASYLATGNINLFRESATYTKVAQSFTVPTGGPMPFIDMNVLKTNSPTGYWHWTLEADVSGSPSGTPLATSDKIDVSLLAATAQTVRWAFRSPYTLSASTTYWLVANSTVAFNATNYLRITGDNGAAGGYANGMAKMYNGSVWAATDRADLWFKVYVTQNDTAVTMPTGYDQRCLVGWVYNGSGSDFVKFYSRDRKVSQLIISGVVAGGTATFMTLVDLAAVIPPIPVVITPWQLYQTVTGAAIQVSPSIDTTNLGGILIYQTALYSNDNATPVPMEFQHVYYAVSSGSTYIYIKGYEW